MDLELDRKEIFLVSVIILLIVAWTIGNLGGVYFGMQDEAPRGPAEDTDYEGGGKAIHVPDFVGEILFYTAILGSIAYLFLSSEAWKTAGIKVGSFLLMIFFFYFLTHFKPLFRSISSTLPDLPNVDFPAPDIGFGNWSQSTSSSVGSSIGILVLLASSLVFIFFFIRHKKLSEQGSKTEEDISSTAHRAITELHEGEEVRDVIIRNYQKMLIILEREGIKQEISFTPRELENMALNRLSLKKETIDEMTKLFEEAKYSDHPLGEKERTRAIDNFKQIKEELGGRENA